MPFVKNGYFFALTFLTIQMCQNARKLTLCYQYTLLDLILVCSTDTCWNAPALVTSGRSLAAILGLESPCSVLGISSVYPRYILGVRSSSLQYPVSSGPPLIRQPADNPQQVLVRSVPASLINNTGNWVPSDYGRFFPAHVIGVLSISIHIPFTFYCSWFINDNFTTKPLQLFCLDMLGNYSKPIVS